MKKYLIGLFIVMTAWVQAASKGGLVSLMYTTKLAFILTPIIWTIDSLTNWGNVNIDYISLVLGAILIDYVFGSIKHLFFTKTFSIKRNVLGMLTKLTMVAAGGFLFEGLSHLASDATILIVPLKIITRIIVFMYPALSAWENIYITSGERFPPKAWMERLKIWNKTLDIKDLGANQENKNYEETEEKE